MFHFQILPTCPPRPNRDLEGHLPPAPRWQRTTGILLGIALASFVLAIVWGC